MAFIVSANYRDRKSPFRWLIRGENEPVLAARAFKSVRATGVVFGPSNEAEQGFGCTVVAICQTAEGKYPEQQQVRLRFDFVSFVDPNDDVVEKCDVLELGKDGSMVATV